MANTRYFPRSAGEGGGGAAAGAGAGCEQAPSMAILNPTSTYLNLMA